MSNLTHLDNFPFMNMEDFNSAFINGHAEPVVPGDFARKWATSNPNSAAKMQVSLFNGLFPMLFLGLIIYLTFRSEELKWYHSIAAMVVCIFSFSPNISSKFRTISTFILLGATIYLYITNSPFANLIALTFGILLSLKLADYFASKNIVEKILSDTKFTLHLWDQGIMAIKYKDGKVIFKDKKIQL